MQREVACLVEIFNHKEKGELPPYGHQARELVFAKPQYQVVDDILYCVAPDKTIRLILSETNRRKVFDEVYGGKFGGHLREAKIHIGTFGGLQ